MHQGVRCAGLWAASSTNVGGGVHPFAAVIKFEYIKLNAQYGMNIYIYIYIHCIHIYMRIPLQSRALCAVRLDPCTGLLWHGFCGNLGPDWACGRGPCNGARPQACVSSFNVIERSLNAYLDSKKLLFPRWVGWWVPMVSMAPSLPRPPQLPIHPAAIHPAATMS